MRCQQLAKCEQRIAKALEVAAECAQYDGEHHKMWVIDQMVRELTGHGYTDRVHDWQGTNAEEWDVGIAP